MAKKTLLQLVIDVAEQCGETPPEDVISDDLGITLANYARIVFEGMVLKYNIAAHKRITALVALSDLTKPNYMQVPSNARDIYWIKYDVTTPEHLGRTVWKTIERLDIDKFFLYTQGRDNTLSEVDEIEDFGGTPIKIHNDRPPTYYTSIDDYTLIFDSYDRSVDSALQATKSLVHHLSEPTVAQTDEFMIPLPSNLFPILEAKVIERYYAVYLQEDMPASLQRELRSIQLQSQKQHVVDTPKNRKTPYGR